MSAAHALATPAGPRRVDGHGSNQFLTFLLHGEAFAIGILQVKEIIEFGGLTTVPMMPPFVRGVINLRGSVVSVIDLAARFGQDPSEITRRTCIVIVEMRGPEGVDEVGIVVDSVTAVREIDPDQIEPPPAFGARIRSEFICGMGRLDDRFIIVLDVDRVLSLEELSAVVQARQAVC